MSQTPDLNSEGKRKSRCSNARERQNSKEIQQEITKVPSKVASKTSTPGWAHPSQRTLSLLDEISNRSKIQQKDVNKKGDSANQMETTPDGLSGEQRLSKHLVKPAEAAPVKDRSSIESNDKSPPLIASRPGDKTKLSIDEESPKKEKSSTPTHQRSNRTSKRTRISAGDKVDNQSKNSDYVLSSDMTGVHPDFLDESYLQKAEGDHEYQNSGKTNFKGRRFTEHKKMKIADFRKRIPRRHQRGFLAGAPDWELTKRLPDDVIPFHYTVYLEPHIESNLFYGKVAIAIDLIFPKAQIWLHARNLQITSTQLFDASDDQIPILGAHKFRNHEFLVIFLEGNLRPGLYALHIDFNGILSPRNSVGIFSRSFKLRDGTTRQMVCTQLEPLYARRVFPCFDEPNFKASFDISAVRPTTDYVAISNGLVEKEEEGTPQKGTTTVHFQTVESMSPYNFVLVVSPLIRTSIPVPDCKTSVNLYTKDDKLDNCSKAVDVLTESVRWFKGYFEAEFPFPKLDLVIAPELSVLAIEGSSLVIIQEELLKAQEEYEYETLHYTVARLVASQWIGCSVTVSWWSDLWYKEGLTMMLVNLFLDTNYPEQQAIPNFLCYLMQPCLFNDTLDNTKRIDRIIHDPNDIAEYMDPIAFTKAASVFRMLEQTDPLSFKDGLKQFLNTFKMQNATWNNLSKCLQDANEKTDMYTMNLDNVFASWSQYPGYPLVMSARGQKAVAMTHRRFLSSFDAKTHDMLHFPTWEFPITFAISKEPNTARILCMKADSIDSEVRVAVPAGVCWYKVNIRQSGFYRVVYQEDEWNNIKQILQNKPQLFTVEDRANILDDMFSLSRAGYLCYGQTLITLTYLRCGLENHWLPWACILKHLTFIKNSMAKDRRDLDNFENYISYILEPILNEDAWNVSEKDDLSRRKWKLAVLRLACTMEIPLAKTRAAKMLNAWGDDVKKIKSISLRCLILRYGAPRTGFTAKQWRALGCLYKEEINQLYKYKILGIMSSSGNEAQMNNLLLTIKTDGNINDHGFFTVLYEMATTRTGCLLVWKFIQDNWTYLKERFGPNDSRLVLLFPHIAQMFDEPHLVEEMTAFKVNDISSLQSALNFAKNNVYWNCRYRKTVSSWLNNVQKVLSRADNEKCNLFEKSFNQAKMPSNKCPLGSGEIVK